MLKKAKFISSKGFYKMSNELALYIEVTFIEIEYEMIPDILSIYINSQYAHHLEFQYELFYNQKKIHSLNGIFTSPQKIFIHDLKYHDINNNLQINFKARMNDKNGFDFFNYKFKSKTIVQQIEHLLLNKQNHFSIPICLKKTVEAVEMPIINVNYAGHKRSIAYPPPIIGSLYVIDIHIEKLDIDISGLSNYQIIQIQLAAAEKHIEKALYHHLHSAIIIHGYGKGVLREELHKRLSSFPHVKSFNNNYHPSYGFGATTVFF